MRGAAGFNRVNGKAQHIHAVQDLQALDEIQDISLVLIVDGQASQGSSENDMSFLRLPQ